MPVNFDDSLISADIQVLRNAAVDAFNETERIMKKFERLKGEAFIPVLNELRYAGRHFVDASVASDDNAIRRNLFSAYRHCKRASFDVREIVISFLLVELNEFVVQNYDLEVILSVMPDYRELKDCAASAQNLLRKLDDPAENVTPADADKAINDLLEFQSKVISKEQDIRLIENNRRHKEFVQTLINIISIAIGIIGLIVGLAF